ncbi:MAG: hypothetical protein ACPL7D_05040 [Candidatus Sumerlaeaceae bacterium]|jgi:hypothetical protein
MRTKPLQALIVLLAIIGATPPALLAFMQAIPDELKDKPEAEHLKWLNSEFEDAYTLQLKVAQERHEQRQARKDAVVQTLADQAFEREKLIEEAERQTREEMEQAAQQANAALGGFVVCAVLLALVAWWRWGRPVYKVESAIIATKPSSEQARREAQEALEALAQRKRRRPPSNS